MNREDIIRTALKAGFADGVAEIVGLEGFSRFAAIVASAEREACAKVCDEQQELVGAEMCCVAINCAAAIRARGQA